MSVFAAAILLFMVIDPFGNIPLFVSVLDRAPAIAGPSAAATILLSATKLASLFGRRGLCAIEGLMGLVLTTIAVEMLLHGLRTMTG